MDKKILIEASSIIKKYLMVIMKQYPHWNESILNFITDDMTPRFAKGVIGLEHYKSEYPRILTNYRMETTLAHDVFGMIRQEKMFIPISDSYVELYESKNTSDE